MRKRFLMPVLFYCAMLLAGTFHFFKVYLSYSLKTVEPLYSGKVNAPYTLNFIVFVTFCVVNLLLFMIWGLREKHKQENTSSN